MQKVDTYVDALVAGNQFVDDEKNILHKPKCNDTLLFHPFCQQGKISNGVVSSNVNVFGYNSFVRNRTITAAAILDDTSFSK